MTWAERMRQAIKELEDIHRPQWASNEAKAKGKDPVGCEFCWPEDGDWPCVSRLLVDDLRSALRAAVSPKDGDA